MSIQRYVDNPVKVIMVFTALLLMGLLSLRRLPLNLFPDVQTPRVSVLVTTTGLSPEEAERRLTADLERQLSSIRGVSSIVSYSRQKSIVVHVDFHWGADIELAYLDVKRSLGSFETNINVKSLEVFRFDPNSAALMTLAFTGEFDRAHLTSFIETTLQPRLETVQGVAYVRANGMQQPEVEVRVDEDVMAGYRLTPEQILESIKRYNISQAGGAVIESGEQMLLKFISRFEDVGAIGRCVVTVVDGFPVHLDEIAKLSVGTAREEVIVRQDGLQTVSLDIYREPDANAVLTARDARALVDQLNARGDFGLKIAVDRSLEVERAINALVDDVLIGMLLSTIVLFFFLRNIIATFVTALVIPISIIGTFSLMDLQGASLNLMTLGGLALGGGMLIDIVVVVVENVFRHRQEGAEPKPAAVNATREVAGAIIASTLTAIVVFVPLIYVHGIAGLLFRDQAMTVVYTQVVSIFVALILIPVLAARIPRGTEPSSKIMIGIYSAVLRRTLALRWIFLIAFIAITGVSWIYLQKLPVEFFPEAVGERLSVTLEMPPGTPLENTAAAVAGIEKRLLGLRYRKPELAPLLAEYEKWQMKKDDAEFQKQAKYELALLETSHPNHPAIVKLGALLTGGTFEEKTKEAIADLLGPMIVLRSLTTSAGVDEDDILAADDTIRGPNTARMEVSLNPDTLDELSAADIVEPLRAEVAKQPGMTVSFESRDEYLQQLLGRSRGDLVIEVHADTLEKLDTAADAAAAVFAATPGLTSTRTNLVLGEDQYVLEPDNDALLRDGIGIDELSQQIEAYLSGRKTEELKLAQGEMPVTVINTRAETQGLEGLLNLQIIAKEGEGRDKLSNLVRVHRAPAVREIMRAGQERTRSIIGDLIPGARYDRTLETLRARLDGAKWPSGTSWNVSIEESRRRESFEKLLMALALAIVLVYMVMAAILESFIHPLTIMLSVPFALVGVVAAFTLTNISLNLMGLIGLVMLVGIVVNNAIVLLDRVSQLRAEGLPPAQALVLAGSQRLRPILMTTLTTVLALVPLAIGIGSGAELRRPLAVSVIGGMMSSTLLTLIILPAIYLCVEDLLALLRRPAPKSDILPAREE